MLENNSSNDMTAGWPQLEGKIHTRAIRVMQASEYRISVQDNSRVWIIFMKLSMLSVGVPLVLWLVVR